jgi:hypothetical protein
MIYVALVFDGLVRRVHVCVDDYMPASGEVVVGRENVVGIGCTYQDGEFMPPLEELDATET